MAVLMSGIFWLESRDVIHSGVVLKLQKYIQTSVYVYHAGKVTTASVDYKLHLQLI